MILDKHLVHVPLPWWPHLTRLPGGAAQGEVRVVKQWPNEVFAGLLDSITSTQVRRRAAPGGKDLDGVHRTPHHENLRVRRPPASSQLRYIAIAETTLVHNILS